MKFLKNILFLVIALQLVILISLLTKYSVGTVGHITDIFSMNRDFDSKDVTLAKAIENREAVEGLVNMISEEKLDRDDKLDSFKSSPIPFDYRAYKQNRYLPLSWMETDNNESHVGKEIEYNAKKFLGRRYVWAANGPECFDCSGFTRYVYKKNGLNLPRHSGNQAKVGMKVAFDELKKGDLVFFDTHKHKNGEVNHVGIYLEDGKFIHASSGNKKVVITSFDEKRYYKSRFLWGRRILQDKIHYAFKSFDNIDALVAIKPKKDTFLNLLSLDEVTKKLMASL